MRRALSRLRWQLTLSHLVAIAVTLVSMIAAVLFIASAWWTHSEDPALQPVQDAHAVANSVGGLVVAAFSTPSGSAEHVQLNTVLRLIQSGALNPVSTATQYAARFQAPAGPSLTNVAYLVIVGKDGSVLGSSDGAGTAFSPAERAEWEPLIHAALDTSTDSAHLVALRNGAGPAAFGAYPVVDSSGESVAAAIVAKSSAPAVGSAWDVWQALLFFGAASLALLSAASLFALASSSIVSYFLSRGLVQRLERLGRAAESIAAGDLTRRVDATGSDEVGELAQRFNAMADRLSETLAELSAEKQTVEAALRAKRELVANVSHELRTPLASIRAHTESLLIRHTGNGEVRRYLEVIDRQSHHLSRLIDDLFLLSTTDAGALPLVPRPLALHEVVEEVVSSVRSAARTERQVRILTEVEADLPTVVGDRQRVVQVLANLVRNAVRHTPEGGLVAVRACSRDGSFAMITVEDTGPGIPPADLERVFERFYRVDASRDRGSGGAGLGLAIVRELVTAMGGEVAASSVVGEGSRFSFTLPFVEARDSRQRPIAEPERRTSLMD